MNTTTTGEAVSNMKDVWQHQGPITNVECEKEAVTEALKRLHLQSPEKPSFSAAEIASDARRGRCITIAKVKDILSVLESSQTVVIWRKGHHDEYSLQAESSCLAEAA